MSVVMYNYRRLVKSILCLMPVWPTWLGSSRKREYSGPETFNRTVFLDCTFAWLLTKASSREWDVVSMSLAVHAQPSITVLHKPPSASLTGSFVCYRRFGFTT